jgi:hypothetical protein
MKLFRMTLTGIMLLGFTSVAIAQQKDSDNGGTPGRVSVDVIKLTGTVKAVDLEKKTVTVEGSGVGWRPSMRRRREIWIR